MQKVREVSKRKNAERCEYVFSLVTSLSRDVGDACKIVNSDCKRKRGSGCSTLTAKVNSTVTLTGQLAAFCRILNKEHKEEFDDFVDDQLDKKLEEIICLSEEQAQQRV